MEKLGRTTGHTHGKVTAFEVDNVVVEYDLGNVRFDDQIEIEGARTGPFSAGGDSGSLIFTTGDRLAAALLFAGSQDGGSNGTGVTYANRLSAALKRLESSGATVTTMAKAATLKEARAAKAKVAQLVSGRPEVNGLGITRYGEGYAVKLNLANRNGKARVPKSVDGVPVRVEAVGRIVKQRRVSSGTAGSSRSSARTA